MFNPFELLRFNPVAKAHLFTLARGTVVQRYCTGSRNLAIAGNTYIAAPGIERTGINQTNERKQNQIRLRFPYLRNPFLLDSEYPPTQALGDWWHPYPPGGPVLVVCASVYPSDPDLEMSERWSGRVVQPRFLSETQMELVLGQESPRGHVNGQGPRLQRSCWKTLYSTGLDGCNLDPDTYAVAGALSHATGVLLRSSAFSDAVLPLQGGFLRWVRADSTVETRSIMSHVGDTITVQYGALDLAPGLEVYAAVGCPRNWSGCEARGNTDNYGGKIYKPQQNPMNGMPLW